VVISGFNAYQGMGGTENVKNHILFSFRNILRKTARADGACSPTGVSWKESVRRCEASLMRNIREARRKLLAGENIRNGFVEFTLRERGKMRHIKSGHRSERFFSDRLDHYIAEITKNVLTLIIGFFAWTACIMLYSLTTAITRDWRQREPFIGGGAIFFAKEPAPCEVINDTNGEMVNFYEVLKRDFTALQAEIEISLHSRERHRQAEVVYSNPAMFDRVKRAWAVWMLANMSYGGKFTGGWRCDRKGKSSAALSRKRDNFGADYAVRRQKIEVLTANYPIADKVNKAAPE
jgi:hypothetical protein